MKLSIYIATRNGSSRNPTGAFEQLLRGFTELADELVVLVDDTSDDDTADVATKYTKHVHAFVHDPLFIEMQRQAFSRCTGDWIFAADDDDRLSSNWTRPLLERLMSIKTVTHYWVPTRYMVDERTYLSTAPYIGHFSVQLFRNIESIAVLPRNLHQQLAVAGEPAYLAGLSMDAMDFVWHDRASRESKLTTYEEAHDEARTNFDQRRFYLYEDYYYETEQAEVPARPAIMEPAGAGVEPGITMAILHAPASMTVGQTYWIAVRIVNNSHRTLLPQSEFLRWGDLALSYRWTPPAEAGAEASPVTPFPARIGPGTQHDALMRVRAPRTPGSYALDVDILEKQRAWLSQQPDAGMFERREIVVRPLIWPPVKAPRDRG